MADQTELQIPERNDPDGGRLRIVDEMAATPVSARGPTINRNGTTGRLEIDGVAPVNAAGDTIPASLKFQVDQARIVLDSQAGASGVEFQAGPTRYMLFRDATTGDLRLAQYDVTGAFQRFIFRVYAGGTFDMRNAASPSVLVPDGTAAGEALAYDQSDPLVENSIQVRSGTRRMRWRIIADGRVRFETSDDDFVTDLDLVRIDNGTEWSFEDATIVKVPAATAAGGALAYGQSGAQLGTLKLGLSSFPELFVDATNSGYITMQLNGVTRIRERLRDSDKLWSLMTYDAAGVFLRRVIDVQVDTGRVVLTGAAAVEVPAAADGDTTTAAQTTALDSTTGRVAVNGAEIGDTGWRDVTADLLNGFTASDIRIRRHGNMVSVANAGLVAPGSQSSYLTLPSGFRANNGATSNDLNRAGWLGYSSAGTSVSNRQFRITGNAGQTLMVIDNSGTLGSGANSLGSFSFVTSDAWPTTLPGTPA